MFAVARMSSLAAGRRLFQCTSKSLRSAADSTVKPAVEAAKEPAKEVVNEGFAKKNPFTFQLIIATGKTMAADLMAQTVAEGKKFDEIDWKRNGIFIVFGFAYLGGFQYWLMINKYRQVSLCSLEANGPKHPRLFLTLLFLASPFSGSHQWIDLPN
jgi:hypothetical protein